MLVNSTHTFIVKIEDIDRSDDDVLPRYEIKITDNHDNFYSKSWSEKGDAKSISKGFVKFLNERKHHKEIAKIPCPIPVDILYRDLGEIAFTIKSLANKFKDKKIPDDELYALIHSSGNHLNEIVDKIHRESNFAIKIGKK